MYGRSPWPDDSLAATSEEAAEQWVRERLDRGAEHDWNATGFGDWQRIADVIGCGADVNTYELGTDDGNRKYVNNVVDAVIQGRAVMIGIWRNQGSLGRYRHSVMLAPAPKDWYYDKLNSEQKDLPYILVDPQNQMVYGLPSIGFDAASLTSWLLERVAGDEVDNTVIIGGVVGLISRGGDR